MKILIIGAGGMLGHQVWRRLNKEFPGQVFGTVRKTASHYESFGLANLIENVDVTDFSSVEKAVRQVGPQWIINCVGITLRKPALGDAEKCIEINSMLPHRLALLGQQVDAKLIHFSTDCVFDGKRGNYKESDLPTAQDLYGKSKFLGEVISPNALTLRLSIVGRELENKTELVEWFLAQKGQAVKGYSHAMYSGLTTNRVAEEICRIISNFPSLSGLYQVSSEPISKFDLLNILNEYFHINAKIQSFAEYRADKTLNCDRYSAVTGFSRPSWKDMIKEMASDKNYL